MFVKKTTKQLFEMKKILLPTDFSKNSWNAICYALELFKTTECLFYLVHTYTPILYNPELSHYEQTRFGTDGHHT